jgi:CAAX prenyl protease-like protein
MAQESWRLAKLLERGPEAAMPRILPFALFMGFIALETLLRWAAGLTSAPDGNMAAVFLWLYPLRIAVVLAALVYLWPAYDELRDGVCRNFGEALLVLVVGGLVYVAWVRMDWSWAMQGQPTGYNPFQAGAGVGILLASLRLVGAVVVVPIMEELFWRSFLIRYLVTPTFTTVRLGTFTPLSFGATVVLFGLEHHLWLAGIMAGVIYNLLLYKTRRLWPCILAHAITNLLLGIHVLVTGEWHWW